MAKIGFARVSSSQQDLTVQLTALEAAGCEKVFQGKHSGKADTNKAALNELLDYVRSDDTVYVTKIDRFGRSLSQVLVTLDTLKERGVNLIAIDQNINTNDDDPMSTAMVQLLGMFAEMERNFIVTRTTEGKKASGNYGGRKSSLTDEQKKDIQARLIDGESQNKLSKEYGVSRVTIARAGGYGK
jgi:DNA invertase Pin-like site-specific DNA recombinase